MDGIRGTARGAIVGDAYANPINNVPIEIGREFDRHIGLEEYRQQLIKQKQLAELRNKLDFKPEATHEFFQPEVDKAARKFWDLNYQNNLNPNNYNYGLAANERQNATDVNREAVRNSNHVKSQIDIIKGLPDYVDKNAELNNYLTGLQEKTKDWRGKPLETFSYTPNPASVNKGVYNKGFMDNRKADNVSVEVPIGKDEYGRPQTQTNKLVLNRNIFEVENDNTPIKKGGYIQVKPDAINEYLNTMPENVHKRTIYDAAEDKIKQDDITFNTPEEKQKFFTDFESSLNNQNSPNHSFVNNRVTKELNDAAGIGFSQSLQTGSIPSHGSGSKKNKEEAGEIIQPQLNAETGQEISGHSFPIYNAKAQDFNGAEFQTLNPKEGKKQMNYGTGNFLNTKKEPTANIYAKGSVKIVPRDVREMRVVVNPNGTRQVVPNDEAFDKLSDKQKKSVVKEPVFTGYGINKKSLQEGINKLNISGLDKNKIEDYYYNIEDKFLPEVARKMAGIPDEYANSLTPIDYQEEVASPLETKGQAMNYISKNPSLLKKYNEIKGVIKNTKPIVNKKSVSVDENKKKGIFSKFNP
jgi:hypothetical protein